jgi:alpha-mannosidase
VKKTKTTISLKTNYLNMIFDRKTGCVNYLGIPDSKTQIIPKGVGWGNICAWTESGQDVAPKIDENIPAENMTVEDVTVVSCGVLFTEVLVRSRICDSILEQRWKVYNQLPRVDLEVKLLWWGKPKMQIRMFLPLNKNFDDITYETPFYANKWSQTMEGSGPYSKDEMEREEWERYRETVNWMDFSNGKIGINLSSRHAHYYIDGPNLQVVLLRTGINCGDSRRYSANAGERKWNFSFTVHKGDWKKGAIYRRGFEFARPLIVSAVKDSSASANLPESHSFLRLEPSNLVVSAVKSPDRDGKKASIIRFYEMEGNACTAKLQLAGNLKKAYETNLLEEEQKELTVSSDNLISVEVKPYEIKTLKVLMEAV